MVNKKRLYDVPSTMTDAEYIKLLEDLIKEADEIFEGECMLKWWENEKKDFLKKAIQDQRMKVESC